jgi:hypothetical protein
MWTGRTCLFLLTAWLVFNWFGTATKVLRYYNPLPVWDYWRVVEDLRGIQSFQWSVLWRQHNAHRIVFPEIVFAIDMLCLQGRQILPTVLNGGCYFGVFVVFATVGLKEGLVIPPPRRSECWALRWLGL